MDPQQTQQFVHAFMGVYLAFFIISFIIKAVLYIIPMWRICKRAGISPQISLVCAIPLIGRLVTTYIIAFSEWKVLPLAQAGYPPQFPPPSYPPAYPPAPAPVAYPPTEPPTAA